MEKEILNFHKCYSILHKLSSWDRLDQNLEAGTCSRQVAVGRWRVIILHGMENDAKLGAMGWGLAFRTNGKRFGGCVAWDRHCMEESLGSLPTAPLRSVESAAETTTLFR